MIKRACTYCTENYTQILYPNVSMSAQDKIMSGILVCGSHEDKAINKLVSLKLYKRKENNERNCYIA